MRGAVGVADQFVQHQAAAGRQVENGAVDKANSDPRVGRGLDHVSLTNGIASRELNGNARRSADGAAADRGLNVAYDSGKLGAEHGFDLAC
ncbi:hypothetical protein [Bradyrhizobium cenepequi]